MIISTTGIEGKKILAYKGIVFGEVVAGVNMFKIWLLASVMFLEDELVVMKVN